MLRRVLLRRLDPALLLGVVEGALLARLIALLFAARPDNTLIGLILALTAPLVWPFGALDRLAGQPVYGARLELATLAAMLALLLAAAFVAVLRSRRGMENGMRKAKDLLGMAIVHQETGQALAYVRELVFTPDSRRLAAILVDSGGWFHDARVIPWSAVTRVGDVIMVTGDPIVKAKDSPELAENLRQEAKISGASIVTESGERIGSVSDVFVADNGDVVGYEVSQGFLSDLGGRKFLAIGHVRSVGRDAVIADSADLQSTQEGLEQAATRSSDRANAPLPSQPAPVDTPDARYGTAAQAGDAPPRDPLA